MLNSKSEVSNHVKNLIQMLEKQNNAKVKIVRSDNGQEFLIPDFYALKGIIHQTSCVETHKKWKR